LRDGLRNDKSWATDLLNSDDSLDYSGTQEDDGEMDLVDDAFNGAPTGVS
jgi:hypothetical protein